MLCSHGWRRGSRVWKDIPQAGSVPTISVFTHDEVDVVPLRPRRWVVDRSDETGAVIAVVGLVALSFVLRSAGSRVSC
jgi:hypothetical protein